LELLYVNTYYLYGESPPVATVCCVTGDFVAAMANALKTLKQILDTLMKYFLLPLFAVAALQAGQREDWGRMFESITAALFTAYSASKLARPE
jgi:hypothetical protein